MRKRLKSSTAILASGATEARRCSVQTAADLILVRVAQKASAHDAQKALTHAVQREPHVAEKMVKAAATAAEKSVRRRAASSSRESSLIESLLATGSLMVKDLVERIAEVLEMSDVHAEMVSDLLENSTNREVKVVRLEIEGKSVIE